MMARDRADRNRDGARAMEQRSIMLIRTGAPADNECPAEPALATGACSSGGQRSPRI
eukprot:SAG31_NODE_636_length_13344_cov_8.492451_8_plen_57_part_00